MFLKFVTASLAFTLPVLAHAQQGTCGGPLSLTPGTPVTFDTTTALLGGGTFGPCGMAIAYAAWYEFTPQSSDPVTLSTCGSQGDTGLVVSSGTCQSLTTVACDDDGCGLQSRLTFVPTVGTRYLIAVGFDQLVQGTGTLSLTQAPAGGSRCVDTQVPVPSNGGGTQCAFFDLDVQQSVTLSGLETALYAVVAGVQTIDFELYVTPTTHVGVETNAAVWTLAAVDDGSTQVAAFSSPVVVRLASPVTLPAGRYGVALRCLDATIQLAPNVNAATVVTSADGQLTATFGASSSNPFVPGAAVFTPRLPNLLLCYEPAARVGVSYCGPAALNSAGRRAEIVAYGTDLLASNDLTLAAQQLPADRFGFFLAARARGFVQQPGGSAGNLCLGGAIGRFVAPGQVQSSGALGRLELRTDVTSLPMPAGSVAAAIGELWTFQAWYRDLAGGGPGSNFTDAVEVVFR